MEAEDIDVLISQMQLGVPNHMSAREKLEKLIMRADTIDGARRILTLSNDKDTILRKLIKTAFSLDIIKKSSSETEILWSKGGEPVCTKVPKRTLEDSLILFFATEDGAEVLRILKDTVESRQKAKKETKKEPTKKAEPVKE